MEKFVYDPGFMGCGQQVSRENTVPYGLGSDYLVRFPFRGGENVLELDRSEGIQHYKCTIIFLYTFKVIILY